MSDTDLSTEALQVKYAEERDKRLRADTVGQYRALDDVFPDFDQDPYTSRTERDAVVEDIDVAVVGGGIGGLVTAARLVERDVTSVRLIDKAGDFGGTWYWNRYPGAACDIVSYIYLPLLEETGYVPSEKYARAPEILAHCQRIARKFDLYPKALFQTEIEGMVWNDETSRWLITTDRGDRLSARFVIMAGGILHKAKLPGIPGIESFKGHRYHTSRWDYAYTGGGPDQPMDRLHGKRVALIGTGATAVQCMPKLAEAAGELLVFQRTPSGVGERGNRRTTEAWKAALQPGWQRRLVENFTRIAQGKPVEEDLIQDGWTKIFLRNPGAMGVMDDRQLALDAENMKQIRRRIEATVKDKVTAEALKPWYNQMCKRPCFHDEFLPAFNRPNVTLVDTAGRGVERITEDAVVVDGVSYPVDCIVFASGFEVGGSHLRLLGFEIYGRDGVSLTDAWAGGPQTLHGIFLRGFPNLFRFSLTQGGIAINFSHLLGELATHVASLVRSAMDQKVMQVEPTAEAQEHWFQTLLANAGSLGMFYAQCTPSYMNGEGNTQADLAALRHMPFFGGTIEYIDILRQWREAGDFPGLEMRRQGEPARTMVTGDDQAPPQIAAPHKAGQPAAERSAEAAQSGADASVHGVWDAVVNSPLGAQKSTLHLSLGGGEITGQSIPESGPAMALLNGKVDGDTVGWTLQVTTPMKMKVVFKAKLDGHSMAGTAAPGIFGKMPFKATKRA